MKRALVYMLVALVFLGVGLGLGAAARFGLNDGLDARTSVKLNNVIYSRAAWADRLRTEERVAGEKLSKSERLASLLADEAYRARAQELGIDFEAQQRWTVHDLFWRCCSYRADHWEAAVKRKLIIEDEVAGRSRAVIYKLVEDRLIADEMEAGVNEALVREEAERMRSEYEDALAYTVARFATEEEALDAAAAVAENPGRFAQEMQERGARVEDLPITLPSSLPQEDAAVLEGLGEGDISDEPILSLTSDYAIVMARKPTQQERDEIAQQLPAAAEQGLMDEIEREAREQVRKDIAKQAETSLQAAWNVSAEVSSSDIVGAVERYVAP